MRAKWPVLHLTQRLLALTSLTPSPDRMAQAADIPYNEVRAQYDAKHMGNVNPGIVKYNIPIRSCSNFHPRISLAIST